MTLSGRDRDIPLDALTLEPFGLTPGLGGWEDGEVHSLGGAEVTIPLPEREDVAKVLYHGDSGDGWDGTEAAVLKLNDGRLMAWETSWGPTGHGFCADAYGGGAEVWFAPETMLAELVLQALTDQGRDLCGIPREGFYIVNSGPEVEREQDTEGSRAGTSSSAAARSSGAPPARTTARLREGTEVLRTGGGVFLSASECGALLDLIESARYLVEEVNIFNDPTRAVEAKLPMRDALARLGAIA